MIKIDVNREIRELKQFLSYSKNIGFFFGAGTSCALGLPNIAGLTQELESNLTGRPKEIFNIIANDLKSLISNRSVNVEDILNHIRQIRELTKENISKKYLEIGGKDAVDTDNTICKNIYKIITEKESKATFEPTKRFLAWYNSLNHDYGKEIFTTNYDLVIEKSLETNEIPYIDGFVGSFEPFFWQECVDHQAKQGDLTKNWIRLWKIHGSLSWFWKASKTTNSHRIIRIGNVGKSEEIQNELVIYPSKDKYDSSRKRPFIAYFDRLRNYLLNGELLFVFSGYSFSDQHINDIVFNCMRQNNRLFVIVFFFTDSEVENLYKLCSPYLNLHVFGPTKAIINGEIGEWSFDKSSLKANEQFATYWSEEESKLTLGDFTKLVSFFIASSGKTELLGSADK